MLHNASDNRLLLTTFERDSQDSSLILFEQACLVGIQTLLSLYSDFDVAKDIANVHRLSLRKLISDGQVDQELLGLAARTDSRYILYGTIRPVMSAGNFVERLDLVLCLFDALKEQHCFEFVYPFNDFQHPNSTLASLRPQWFPLLELIRWVALLCVSAIDPKATFSWLENAMKHDIALSLDDYYSYLNASQVSDEEERLDTLIRLSQEAPRMLLVWQELARLSKSLGEHEMAKTALTNVWELLTEQAARHMRAEVATDIGVSCALLDDLDHAYDWWYKAIQTDPEFIRPYINMSLSLEEQLRFQEAETLLKKAISYFPRDTRIYSHLARLFSVQQTWQEAIEQYRHLVTLEPADPWYHSDLANCYLQLGDINNAKTHLERAMALDSQGEAGKTAGFILSNLAMIGI